MLKRSRLRTRRRRSKSLVALNCRHHLVQRFLLILLRQVGQIGSDHVVIIVGLKYILHCQSGIDIILVAARTAVLVGNDVAIVVFHFDCSL